MSEKYLKGFGSGANTATGSSPERSNGLA